MKQKKTLTPMLYMTAAVLAAAGVLAAVILWQQGAQQSAGLEMEQNATVGILPGVDLAKRKEQLQTRLDESQIAFSINTNPQFETGSSEGNILLENPANNAKLLTAEIVLNDSDEVVYSSKAIAPGTYLKNIRLDKALAKGRYEATVYLKAYHLDTQKLIGQTGAAVTLAVLK